MPENQVQSNDPSAPPLKRRRSLIAFFFKSALGCTAFALGMLVMVVLLLPTIASGLIKNFATDAFADRFRGRIEIADAKFAWFGEQKLDGVVVRDPEGEQIARASAVLPSLIGLMGAGDGKIGKVRLDVDADLVQDDAGVTNLQRALEQRAPSAEQPEVPTGDAQNPLDMLARLDLDLEVKSKKLTWSDRETRRVGIPFEVRDLAATVKARPRTPIVVHASGKVVSEQPGALNIDATLAGPIDTKKAWPFGKVDAKVRIEGFSTAMIDGIANQHGNLVEVLGKRFTLTATADGATTTAGNVEIALDGERAGIAFSGRFEDGVLRSGDKTGLVASFPAPRGFLKEYVDANLPSGTTLALDAGTKPWTVTAPSFAIPLPPSGANDLASLAPTLERAALDLRVEIPSRFAFENDVTRAGGVKLAARTMQANVKLAPGEPLVARVEAVLESGSEGSLVVDVSARDAWKKLGEGALPIVDLEAHVKGLSTGAVGALAGQAERMTFALGSVLELDIEAKNVSLDAGNIHMSIVGREGTTTRAALDLTARVEGGEALIDGSNKLSVRLSPSAEWLSREMAAVAPPGADIVVQGGEDAITFEVTDVVVPLPGGTGGNYEVTLRDTITGSIALRVAGASYADATLKAARTQISTSGISASAKLEPGGAITVSTRGDLQQGASSGKFVVDGSTTDVFALVGLDVTQPLPPVDASIVITNLPAALVDAFVQRDNLVERALGDKLSLALHAKGASATSGTVRVEVEAPNAKLSLGGRLESGVFKASGEDTLHVELRVPEAVLRDQLGTALPAETALKWPNGVAAITLDARDVSVALPKQGDPQPFDLGTMLDGIAARVNLALAGVGFENAQTKRLKIDAAARDVVVEATVAPKSPLALKMRANLSPGRDAKLALDATIDDPFAIVKGGSLKPIDGKLELTGLDTHVIDALAGQDGLIAGLVGPELAVTIVASDASPSSGALVIDASAPAMTLHASARFDDAGLHMDGQEGLDVRITPAPEFVESWMKKSLPAGTRLKLASDAGPLVVKVRDVSIPMPKPGEESTALQRLSQLAFKLEAEVPGLVYSDAATDAAQKPVTVTGVRLASTFAAGSNPFVSLTGTIVDESAGEIAADMRALDPLTKLQETNGLDTFRAKIDVRATRIPTAIVDVLARQDGLLVEALGPRLNLTVSAPDISMQSGAFQLDMHSDAHRVKGTGRIDKGMVLIDQVDGLVATVGLGPVMSQRVVGKLVPTLVNVSKPSGATPAKFSVDALNYPLDGDLRKLDGIVRVDLGEVNYSLFPKLASFFNDASSSSSLKIPAITVPITKGVAGYQRLPVMISGREYIFSGTYDIVTDAAQLTANVPVSLLGKRVSSELEKLREYIDPNITVPLTIKGSLVNPSIGVDEKALLKVLKDAGVKALGGAAGGLLEDLLKKKKKKD